VPHAWINRMKIAMRTLCPFFNSNRLVRQYVEEFYMPSLTRYTALSENGLERAKSLAAWKARVQSNWSGIKIVEVKAGTPQELKVRDALTVHAWLDLGPLTPDDVEVELYQGQLDADGEILWPNAVPMLALGQTRGPLYEFACEVSMQTSGQHGYTVRVLPNHPDLGDPYKQGLILWA
jgi:starch phosphorylase